MAKQPDQIQIRWSSASGKLFEASMDALRTWDPEPSLKGAAQLTGNYTREAMDQVVTLAQNLGIDAKLSVDVSYADAETPPRYVGGINFKGAFTRESLDQILSVGQELGLDVGVILTATWGKNQDVSQLQLFPPAFRNAPEQ